MSEQERHEAIGRAFEELKRARSEQAVLGSKLRRCQETFTQIAAALGRFIDNPLEGGGLAPQSENLQKHLNALRPAECAALVQELFLAADRARLLQKETESF